MLHNKRVTIYEIVDLSKIVHNLIKLICLFHDISALFHLYNIHLTKTILIISPVYILQGYRARI